MTADSNKTICLIDDDAILQFIFTEIVSRFEGGYQSLVFSNGKEALDYFLANKEDAEKLPGLVILDLNMPVMDGWSFLDEYIQHKSEIAKLPAIYIMSSSTHPKDKKKATTYQEILGYYDKPITKEKLSQMLEESFNDHQ